SLVAVGSIRLSPTKALLPKALIATKPYTLDTVAGLTTRISPPLLTMSPTFQLLSQSVRALAAVKLAAKIAPVPRSVKLNQASMMLLSALVAPVPSKAWLRCGAAAAGPPIAARHSARFLFP